MQDTQDTKKALTKLAGAELEKAYSSNGYRKVHISELYYPMNILVKELIEKNDEDSFSIFNLACEKDLQSLYDLNVEYVWVLKSAVIPKKTKPEEVSEDKPKNEPLIEELGRSKNFFKESYNQTRSILDSVRKTGILKVEEMASVVDEITSSVARNPNTLLCMRDLQSADEYTYFHSINVSLLATVFAQFLGYSEKEIWKIGLAGVLHDIGKQKIPLNILNASRKLTEKEFEIIKLHPLLAREILNDGEGLEEGIIEGVSFHHEKFDGTGYPYGIEGDAIHPYAVILSLADVYDALTSERVYKHAFNQNKTAAIIYSQKDTRFPANMVNQFICCFGVYPIGSMVRLSNKTLGIVYENNSDDLLHPKILQVSGSFDNFLPNKIKPIDLREADEDLRIVSCEGINDHNIDLEKILLNLIET